MINGAGARFGFKLGKIRGRVVDRDAKGRKGVKRPLDGPDEINGRTE